MNFDQQTPVGRRAFLRAGLRYGLLAGLGALAARTVAGRRNQSCTNRGVCAGCPEFTGCELPQALSARQAGPAASVPAGGYEEIRRIPAAGGAARALEIGPDGLLYIAVGDAVLVRTAEGEIVREIALGAPGRCIAVAADGTLYAGLRDRVVRMDAGGGSRAVLCEATEKRSWFTGLAVARDALFVADAGNRVILRLDLAGRLVGRIGAKDAERDVPGFIVPSPYFTVGLHPDGLLRVNNPGRHRVEAYTVDGEFAGAWGEASGRIEGFCGCCNPIRAVPLADGRVLTCEKGLPRVKIYSATGEFETAVALPHAFPENARVGAGERDADAALAGLSAAADGQGRIAILDHVTGEIRLFRPRTA